MVPETRVFQLGSRRLRLGDPSLHRFWLIHQCNGRTDGRTDRIAMAKKR